MAAVRWPTFAAGASLLAWPAAAADAARADPESSQLDEIVVTATLFAVPQV